MQDAELVPLQCRNYFGTKGMAKNEKNTVNDFDGVHGLIGSVGLRGTKPE
ncbi:hypothetical protein GCM10007199_40680 [Fictibacillus barbaricus]|nr:hypothetical protein GCM10007199_40680 [Fictibacillus barbaricus]